VCRAKKIGGGPVEKARPPNLLKNSRAEVSKGDAERKRDSGIDPKQRTSGGGLGSGFPFGSSLEAKGVKKIRSKNHSQRKENAESFTIAEG